MTRRHHDPRTVATTRCAAYRKALRGTALSVPAGLLRHESVAQWVRRRGLGVDVAGVDELGLVLAAGLPSDRVAAQCVDVAAVEEAVGAGVGRFVVGRASEAELLADCAASTQLVLLDVSHRPVAEMAAAVMGVRQLEVVGLQCRLGDADTASAAESVRAMVGQMAWLRQKYSVILTRACLIGFCCDEPDRVRLNTELLQLTVEDACARHRYPRPALVLSLHEGAILGSG